jgi:hypothetical protein
VVIDIKSRAATGSYHSEANAGLGSLAGAKRGWYKSLEQWGMAVHRGNRGRLGGKAFLQTSLRIQSMDDCADW